MITGVKRYATWIDRHAIAVLLVSVVVAVVGGMLAARLPLQSDLTSLLPSSQSSVRELKAIQKRARPFGTVQIVIESQDAARAAAASDVLANRITSTVDPALIAQFSRDDGPRDRYAWANRFLFADYQDLVDAKAALEERIRNAKLEANPLYIALDDDDKAATDRLSELEKKLDDLEQRATHPPARESKDGRMRVFAIQTTFSASENGRAHALVGGIKSAMTATGAEFADVKFDLTGNIIMGMHEHDSVLEGMALSLAFTVLLCGLALVVYYRSGRVVLAMLLGARRRRGRDVRDRLGHGRPPQRDDGVPVRDRRRQRHQRIADLRRALPRGAAHARARTRRRSARRSPARCPARSLRRRPRRSRMARCSSPTSAASASSARSRASAWC